MLVKKIIILFAILFTFIGSLLFFSYIEDRRSQAEILEALQKDPYEIKKVQNFNYQPQYYVQDFEDGSLLFLTKKSELYKCNSTGIIRKIKTINLKVKKMYYDEDERECFFLDDNGNLYYTSILSSSEKLTKIKGISNVNSFSIAEGYYSALTEDGNLYMWLKEKIAPKEKNLAPFKSLTSYSPKFIPSFTKWESVVSSLNYMILLTKSGAVYECGIKESEESGAKKEIEPIFTKIENLKEVQQIALVEETDLIAISKHKIYRIGYSSIPDVRAMNEINYTIEQMSSGYSNIAYVTNHGDVYVLGDSFWEHDPTFDTTIPKKLNGIQNADAVYGGGIIYVIKDNEVYIIHGIPQSSGCK